MAKKKSAFERFLEAGIKAQAKGKDPLKAGINKLNGDAKKRKGIDGFLARASAPKKK